VDFIIFMLPHQLFGTICGNPCVLMPLVVNKSLVNWGCFCMFWPTRRRRLWER